MPGGGASPPIGNGTVLAGGMVGSPSGTTYCGKPTAHTELPCGTVDSRAMLSLASGSLVGGIVIQIPGSMCSAPPVAASVTRCR